MTTHLFRLIRIFGSGYGAEDSPAASRSHAVRPNSAEPGELRVTLSWQYEWRIQYGIQ